LTICIAAICDNSKAIVAASDRMMTANYPAIEFEHNTPKIDKISENCVALTAGNALAHIELIRTTQSIIKKIKKPPIADIKEKIKDAYAKQRTKRATEFFLKPRGIDSTNEFWQNSRTLPLDIVGMIDKQMTTLKLGLELIITGVDDEAHIYGIRNPGLSECYDTLGYYAIGSGETHVLSFLILNEYTPDLNIEEAKKLVFEAKKLAQVAPGVGKNTDMVIIKKTGITEIPEKEVIQMGLQLKSKRENKWQKK